MPLGNLKAHLTFSIFSIILATMKIWSIQSDEAWESLKHNGRLCAYAHHQASQWPEAYRWMTDQMHERIGPPPKNTMVPLWGWYQWAGTERKRPDLRTLRHHWGPEGNYVLLECEINDQHVLLSDFDAWHVILGKGFLGLDESEDTHFSHIERMGKKNLQKFGSYLNKKIKRSWGRVFDMEALNSDYWGKMEQKSIQACFWSLHIDQIRSAKPFCSKYSAQ